MSRLRNEDKKYSIFWTPEIEESKQFILKQLGNETNGNYAIEHRQGMRSLVVVNDKTCFTFERGCLENSLDIEFVKSTNYAVLKHFLIEYFKKG